MIKPAFTAMGIGIGDAPFNSIISIIIKEFFMKKTKGTFVIQERDNGVFIESEWQDGEERLAVTVTKMYGNEDIDKADAEYICKAVNSYEDLLNACKMELWAIENGESAAQKEGKPRLSERLEILKTLIQKLNP